MNLRARETLNSGMVMILLDWPQSPRQVWRTWITFQTIHLIVNTAPLTTVSILSMYFWSLIKYGLSGLSTQACVMHPQVACLDSWAHQSLAAVNPTLNSLTQNQVSIYLNSFLVSFCFLILGVKLRFIVTTCVDRGPHQKRKCRMSY